jgi:hypothetical protein
MLVIPVNRVADTKKNNQKKWRAEEEERHKGSLTPSPPQKKRKEMKRTFPKIQSSLLVMISTRVVGVQVTRTRRSATDRLSRNRLVELLLKTLLVRMTTRT